MLPRGPSSDLRYIESCCLVLQNGLKMKHFYSYGRFIRYHLKDPQDEENAASLHRHRF